MGKNDEENATAVAQQPQLEAGTQPGAGSQPEVGTSPPASKAKEGEVLPPAGELREIQANTAMIAAIGQQIQVILQTPGIEGFLKGLGEERAANAALVTMNAKNQHELQMEREKRETAAQAEREKRETDSLTRKETFAIRWIYILTILIPIWFFALAYVVHKQVITTESATTITVIVGVAVTGLRNVFGKKQGT